MDPEVYWSVLRSQIEGIVTQIDQDTAKEGPQEPGKLANLRHALSRVTIAAASDSLELGGSLPTSKSQRDHERHRVRKQLVEDVLTSVSILCVAADDPEQAAEGRAFLRTVMIQSSVELSTWTLATKLLLTARGVLANNGGGPAGLLREECGGLFEFFFDSSADGDGEDVDSEDSKFFVDGTARLLGITLECLHECPNDDESSVTDLFSTNLIKSPDASGAGAPDDPPSEEPMTLARFLNGALESKSVAVRALTYEAVGLAAAKAPRHLAEPVASVFARASARDTDRTLRAATAALGWGCVQRGGPNALAASLPELGDALALGSSSATAGWLRSIASAVSCLSWSSSPLEDRQEVALALITAQLRMQASGSSAGRIFDRIVASARNEAAAEALVGAAERGTSLILADARFDLEDVLCGTAPPCELRDAVEAAATALLLATQRSSGPSSVGSPSDAPSEAFTKLWHRLHSAIEEDLARTDQQGYAAVLLQWLLGKCTAQTINVASMPQSTGSPDFLNSTNDLPRHATLKEHGVGARRLDLDEDLEAADEVESSGDEFAP